ncbi:ATP-binding cassette domain-containing protein [candidate division KSB3 bacterium]|uniref:ATP-binding cassette domain-containing protein n=1 Tax=candidate division KSB3 bacterium TaxID=2044937 RepID=A0A9D5JRR3_9BACT|nr:ATP-binding cassette domain-containing protein [candidate division KSB3 bacterium]MBD3323042.1 ATP-binding cassette domain-containing protein [candidate division KSB3 bacterium]
MQNSAFTENLVYMKKVTKYFGRVMALEDVDFSIPPRTIVGLVGDNGAGKSTLIKIISGVHQPTQGAMYFAGKPMRFTSPKEAIEAGIETTHQDLALVDEMSIYRNIFMGREPQKHLAGVLPWLDKKRMIREARAALQNIGVSIASVEDTVKNLSGGQKQSVAVGKATHFKAKLVIMDEPTAAMSLKETRKILELMVRLKNAGSSVIFISHNIHQVFSIADKLTVLSHGRKIADIDPRQSSEEDVSTLIMNN